MIGRGKLVILTFITLAAFAGGVTIVYHRDRSARPLALWGPAVSGLILRAPKVYAFRIGPADPEQPGVEPLAMSGRSWRIVDRRPIDGARGLLNIRRALLDDSTFDWTEPVDACEPVWTHGLEFADDMSRTRVLFSLSCPRVASEDSGASASIGPSAAGFQAFLDEQFPN
jgi:hypothetical protein